MKIRLISGTISGFTIGSAHIHYPLSAYVPWLWVLVEMKLVQNRCWAESATSSLAALRGAACRLHHHF
jgi:hypothetical protein